MKKILFLTISISIAALATGCSIGGEAFIRPIDDWKNESSGKMKPLKCFFTDCRAGSGAAGGS